MDPKHRPQDAPPWPTQPQRTAPTRLGPSPEGDYAYRNDVPVLYRAVILDDTVIAYVWASVEDDAGGVVSRQLANRGPIADAVGFWVRRLRSANMKDLTPLQALRYWVGEPTGSASGYLPADGVEQEAESVLALKEIARPGSQPDYIDLPAGPPGFLRDGRPLDRSRDWEPLHTRPPRPYYRAASDAPVKYRPVLKEGRYMGYLWASTIGHSAGYLRISLDQLGRHAAAYWNEQLRRACRDGLAPLEALQRWVGDPEHELGGYIPESVGESEAADLAALKEVARRSRDLRGDNRQ